MSSRTRKQLTVEEVLKHPEYKTAVWDLKPSKRGNVPVAKTRGGPINIEYEIHGTGPVHILWIMGLVGSKTAWQRQTKYFGHEHGDKYSSMVFDNRGIGDSDKPWGRYSTSEMAKDAIELLDHVGWTAERSVHVIGVSMGGMIAQELGLLIPERVASLSLVSTAARLVNTVGYVENLRNRINLLIPKGMEQQVHMTKLNLFSEEFMYAPDPDGNFPTAGDRFAAQEIHKRLDKERFQRKGFICQLLAAGWHHKSPEQLKELGDKVGRKRIIVMHGTVDRMITPPHGDTLIQELGGEESGLNVKIFPGRGHALGMEEKLEHNRLIEELVDKTEAMRK